MDTITGCKLICKTGSPFWQVVIYSLITTNNPVFQSSFQTNVTVSVKNTHLSSVLVIPTAFPTTIIV